MLLFPVFMLTFQFQSVIKDIERKWLMIRLCPYPVWTESVVWRPAIKVYCYSVHTEKSAQADDSNLSTQKSQMYSVSGGDLREAYILTALEQQI